MTWYRCYVLDKEDKIASVDSVDATDDADALAKAALKIRVSTKYSLIEVWQGKRIVGRVPGGTSGPAILETSPSASRALSHWLMIRFRSELTAN
jgi:hypothetical protein